MKLSESGVWNFAESYGGGRVGGTTGGTRCTFPCSRAARVSSLSPSLPLPLSVTRKEGD